MKKTGLSIIFTFCLGIFSVNAQTSKKQNLPSDAQSGFTYNYDKVFSLLSHEAVNPSLSNNPALSLVKSNDFPKLSSTTLTAQDFDLIKKWMDAHPNQIIEAYKNDSQIVTPFTR